MNHGAHRTTRAMTLTWLMTTVLAGVGCANARELFVDQKHPEANDQNPGTEAKPFKTIQPAVDKASPGDTIWIKEGIYDQQINVTRSGTIDAPIVMSAWKDDRVRIGSDLKDLPQASEWKAVQGSKSWCVQLPEGTPDNLTVIIDDKPQVTQLKDTPPPDSEPFWATYRKSDRALMVNTGDGNPAASHKLKLARFLEGIIVREQAGFWQFRKLQFSWLCTGMVLCGHGALVEDCFFHKTYRLGIFLHGRLSTIRRCNFWQCGYGVGASGSGPANIIEDCLFVETGQDWKEDIRHREMNFQEGGGAAGVKGDAYAQVFRYNILADCKNGGLWYDGGETGCRVIGNVFWDIPYSGIYNEYSANDTLLLGNYFLHTNIVSSWCTRFNVIDNFVEGGSVVWHNHDVWPYRDSYMIMRGNALTDVPNGYLHHYGRGWGPSYYPNSFTNCMVDFNRFRVRPGQPWLVDAGTKLNSIEDIRKTYGWEIHGEGAVYDSAKNDLTPESMGGSTVTFRLPWGPNSHLSRPMLSDAGINGKWPAAAETFNTCGAPSFFWRVADGNYSDSTLWTYEPWFRHEFRWTPNSTAGYGQGENNGCRWYIDAEPKFATAAKIEGWPGVPELGIGNRWLVMTGVTPEKIPAQGVGYWSPWLATAPGAETTVTMRIRGKDIAPTERGTPAVWMQFINQTGRNKQRAWLLGKDDQGKLRHAELTRGSFDWTELRETVIAPEGAVRMTLFFGVLPCKGELNFDDINIKTKDGLPPVLAKKQEILPPRLPLKRIKENFFVDLSKVANRSLADEIDNDGKGGWSDQGENADMRELRTGVRDFGGVPFKILPAPRSIVVLRSASRNPASLPEKVVIPVGRKADTLFFLQSVAWGGAGEYYRYVINYRDGKRVTLIVNDRNMTDWSTDPVSRFPGEEGSFTTVAETVPSKMFGKGSVYRKEWNAPDDRRPVTIGSIEFSCPSGKAGPTVPILLGITGVMEW